MEIGKPLMVSCETLIHLRARPYVFFTMPDLAMFLIALEIPHLAAAYSSPVQV